MEISIDIIATDLAHRAGAMAAGAVMAGKDAEQPQIDKVVRELLQAGSELMGTCAALAHGPHDQAVNVLLRTLIEMGIKVHWSTLSSNNAGLLQDATKEQLKTIFKVNAKTGIAKITDADGNDHTAEFLASGGADKGPKLPSIETMAEQSGLRDIYNVFYRFQSLHTHTNDVRSDSPQTKLETLRCVGVFSIFLGHISVRWLVHRNRPNNEEIRDLLGLESRVQS